MNETTNALKRAAVCSQWRPGRAVHPLAVSNLTQVQLEVMTNVPQAEEENEVGDGDPGEPSRELRS